MSSKILLAVSHDFLQATTVIQKSIPVSISIATWYDEIGLTDRLENERQEKWHTNHCPQPSWIRLRDQMSQEVNIKGRVDLY